MVRILLFKSRSAECEHDVRLIFGTDSGNFTACDPLPWSGRRARPKHAAGEGEPWRPRQQAGDAGRETLDFFEQLYQELYGDDDAGEGPRWI
jgi:hypothetical protein